MSDTMTTQNRTDKEILGFSRWWLFVLAFLAMSVISPYEYAWSVIAPHFAKIYGWTPNKLSLMFTAFVIFQAFGTLPGGVYYATSSGRRLFLWLPVFLQGLVF
ncbi:hypothetical protein ABK905_18895 [Acerihabitans sp. KWT182]|uniref:MFS transporter n=1 Tax=Acerihabitans sp. KWT182 TaxID=3157919 RepID=A0AAU7Q8H6_9GAMM